MKTLPAIALLGATLAGPAAAQEQSHYQSLRLEIKRAIQTGNAYLKSKQKEDGSWGEPTIPAFTAFALAAIARGTVPSLKGNIG